MTSSPSTGEVDDKKGLNVVRVLETNTDKVDELCRSLLEELLQTERKISGLAIVALTKEGVMSNYVCEAPINILGAMTMLESRIIHEVDMEFGGDPCDIED